MGVVDKMINQDGGEATSLTREQAETVELPRRGERIIKCTTAKKRVYVSFIQDRNADPEIKVFTGSDAAITYTRKRFAKAVACPENIQEHSLSPGWFLNLGYIESDHAFVLDTCLLNNDSQALLERLMK